MRLITRLAPHNLLLESPPDVAGEGKGVGGTSESQRGPPGSQRGRGGLSEEGPLLWLLRDPAEVRHPSPNEEGTTTKVERT